MFRFLLFLQIILLILWTPNTVLAQEVQGDGLSLDNEILSGIELQEFVEPWTYIYIPGNGLYPLSDLVRVGSSGWSAFVDYGVPVGSFEPIKMITLNATRTNSGVVVLMPVEVCIGDFDGDGDVNAGDIMLFAIAYAAGDPAADLTGDGLINIWDQLFFLELASGGCLTW